MRPGKVVSIRLNPKDVMSVIDICEMSRLYVPGMSFAGMTSIAFSAVLQMLRQKGNLPERTGFEYNQLTERYFRDSMSDRGRKLQITDAIQARSTDYDIRAFEPAQPLVTTQHPESFIAKHNEDSIEYREAMKELTDLTNKMNMVFDDVPGISWTEADKARLSELQQIKARAMGL